MASFFYNPGTLLASPDVAVKAPPAETNNVMTALAAAMEGIRENLTAKKKVDDLKAQTQQMADYMQSRSPDLADMLRKRAEGYKPTAFTGYSAIDTESEKDNLLKGVIDLYGKDLQEKRLDAQGNSVTMQNNFGTKLRASENQLSNVNNNWNSFEAAETRRETEHNDLVNKLAAEGKADGMTRYVRRENPYTAQKTQAEADYNRLLNASTEDIAAMGTPSKVKTTGAPSDPIIPSYGIQTPMTDDERQYDQDSLFPDTSGRPAAPADDFGGFIDPLTGDRIPETLEGSQSTENPAALEMPPTQPADNDPGSILERHLDKKKQGEEVTPPVSSAPVGDPIQVANEAAKQRNAGNVVATQKTLDVLIQGLKRERGTYIDKQSADAAIAQGEQIKEEISSLPDPGTKAWQDQARSIISAYKTSIAGLLRDSAASEKNEQSVANQEQLTYYVKGSVKKEPITVYKRLKDGVPRFFIQEGGKDVEVTNRIGVDFVPLNSAEGPATTNTTTTGAKPLSIKDLLNK